MTDKEILEATKAEIIRRMEVISGEKRKCHNTVNPELTGGFTALKGVLEFINTKERSQEDKALKDELKTFLDKTGAPYYWAGDDEQLEWVEIIAQHFADWQKQKDKKGFKLLKEWFEEIAERCRRLTSGNVSHNGKAIHGFARNCAEYIKTDLL